MGAPSRCWRSTANGGQFNKQQFFLLLICIAFVGATPASKGTMKALQVSTQRLTRIPSSNSIRITPAPGSKALSPGGMAPSSGGMALPAANRAALTVPSSLSASSPQSKAPKQQLTDLGSEKKLTDGSSSLVQQIRQLSNHGWPFVVKGKQQARPEKAVGSTGTTQGGGKPQPSGAQQQSGSDSGERSWTSDMDNEFRKWLLRADVLRALGRLFRVMHEIANDLIQNKMTELKKLAEERGYIVEVKQLAEKAYAKGKRVNQLLVETAFYIRLAVKGEDQLGWSGTSVEKLFSYSLQRVMVNLPDIVRACSPLALLMKTLKGAFLKYSMWRLYEEGIKINHTRDYLLLSLGFSSKELQETEVAAAFHASTAVYVTLFTTWRLFYIAYDTFKRKLAKEVANADSNAPKSRRNTALYEVMRKSANNGDCEHEKSNVHVTVASKVSTSHPPSIVRTAAKRGDDASLMCNVATTMLERLKKNEISTKFASLRRVPTVEDLNVLGDTPVPPPPPQWFDNLSPQSVAAESPRCKTNAYICNVDEALTPLSKM